MLNISIHAPRGGSDSRPCKSCAHRLDFNPRSPWGERLGDYLGYPTKIDFNPRSPWGERPVQYSVNVAENNISIHAPRGGSDDGGFLDGGFLDDFNPRSPWGERHQPCRSNGASALFQSTLPVGGAT